MKKLFYVLIFFGLTLPVSGEKELEILFQDSTSRFNQYLLRVLRDSSMADGRNYLEILGIRQDPDVNEIIVFLLSYETRGDRYREKEFLLYTLLDAGFGDKLVRKKEFVQSNKTSLTQAIMELRTFERPELRACLLYAMPDLELADTENLLLAEGEFLTTAIELHGGQIPRELYSESVAYAYACGYYMTGALWDKILYLFQRTRQPFFAEALKVFLE